MANTLKKIERLKHDTQIKEVFSSGIRFMEYPIRVNYAFLTSEITDSVPVKVLIGCSKRGVKKAVHRNRIKRLIREVYRCNNNELNSFVESANAQLGLSLIFIGNEMPDFEYIDKKINKALVRLLKNLSKDE